MDERDASRVCETCGRSYAKTPIESYADFSARRFCSWACYLVARKAGLIPWRGRATCDGPYHWAPGEEPPLGFCAAGERTPVSLKSNQVATIHGFINARGNRFARWALPVEAINAALSGPERQSEAA